MSQTHLTQLFQHYYKIIVYCHFMITAVINKYYYITYENCLNYMCSNISIQYRLQTQLRIYADKIMYFLFLTSLIMRVISACYTKSRI